MVEREGGETVYSLLLLENRETNVETGNICQTHIFSDLSRPSFLQKQFNFPAVVPNYRLIFRGKICNVLQITRIIF